MTDFGLPAWLSNTHLQTIGSVLVSRIMRPFPSENRLFQLTDGSSLTAECSWQTSREGSPTVVIVPGLNGSTISSYIRGTAAKAYAQGFNVIRINLRNGGNSERYSKTLLHAGQSSDIHDVVKELISKDGLPSIGLICFSFGGNICLKAMAEWRENPPKQLIGAVGISPLIDLTATADAIDHQAPFVYRYQMLRGLVGSFKVRAKLFPGQYNPSALRGVKDFRSYDSVAAPYNGFESAEDYYQKASAVSLLSQIQIPTLLIHADDDVVIPVQSFDGIDNPHISVLRTRGGGHGGFIAGKKEGDPDRHWAENRAIEYLLSLAGKIVAS